MVELLSFFPPDFSALIECNAAHEVLRGNGYKLKLGFIPVVNRSQEDIDNNKKITHALEAEEEFFKKHFSSVANQCGTPHLAQTLHKTLIKHIHKKLPSLRGQILEQINSTKAQYLLLGGKIGGEVKSKSSILSELLRQYALNFANSVNAISVDIPLDHL